MSRYYRDPTTGNEIPIAGMPTRAEIIEVAESSDVDTADNITTFTSSDTTDADATAWTSVAVLATGEKHSSILAKISQMFKNIRYLYKQQSALGSAYANTKSNITMANWQDVNVTHTINNLPSGKYMVFYKVGNSENAQFQLYNYTDGMGVFEGTWSSSPYYYTGTVVSHNGGNYTRQTMWRNFATVTSTTVFITMQLVKVG